MLTRWRRSERLVRPLLVSSARAARRSVRLPMSGFVVMATEAVEVGALAQQMPRLSQRWQWSQAWPAQG